MLGLNAFCASSLTHRNAQIHHSAQESLLTDSPWPAEGAGPILFGIVLTYFRNNVCSKLNYHHGVILIVLHVQFRAVMDN